MPKKNDPNSQDNRCSCPALRKASRPISQLYDAAAPSGLKTTQRAIREACNFRTIVQSGYTRCGEIFQPRGFR